MAKTNGTSTTNRRTNKGTQEITPQVNTQNTSQPPQDTPQGTNNSQPTPQDNKAEKRNLTYRERVGIIPTTANTPQGNQWELTKEGLQARLTKVLGMAKMELFIPGYMGGEEKQSSFKKLYGMDFKDWQLLKEKDNQGKLIILSVGANKLHYLIIIPNKELTVKDRSGQPININQENYLNHIQIFTNHGRAYKVGRILSKEYNLYYNGIQPGEYTISNNTNYNFNQLPTGNWQVYTRKGSLKDIKTHPLEYLQGEKDILEII